METVKRAGSQDRQLEEARQVPELRQKAPKGRPKPEAGGGSGGVRPELSQGS